MDALRLIILVLYSALGLLLTAISLPLIRRKVAPNSLYGFRVRRTLEDPKVWYDVNEYSGRCLFRLGIWTSISAIVLYFVPGISAVAYALACLATFSVGMAVCLFLSVRFLNDLPRS
jgi:hypothetical protein